jgi:hypothetical protein
MAASSLRIRHAAPLLVLALAFVFPRAKLFCICGAALLLWQQHSGHSKWALTHHIFHRLGERSRYMWRRVRNRKPEDIRSYVLTSGDHRIKITSRPSKGRCQNRSIGTEVKALMVKYQNETNADERLAIASHLAAYLHRIGMRGHWIDVCNATQDEVRILVACEMMGLTANGTIPLASLDHSDFENRRIVFGDPQAAWSIATFKPHNQYLRALVANGRPIIVDQAYTKDGVIMPGYNEVRPIPMTPRLLILEDERRRHAAGPQWILDGRDLVTGKNKYTHITKFENHIVTGQPESGKSVYFHGVANQLYGCPDCEGLGIIDAGKKGVEFSRYKGHPKVTVAINNEQTCRLIKDMRLEMDERFVHMEKIDKPVWPEGTKVLMIDEWLSAIFDFTPDLDHLDEDDPEFDYKRNEAIRRQKQDHAIMEDNLSLVLSKGRAARMRVVGAGQDITQQSMLGKHRKKLQQVRVCFKQDMPTVHGLYGETKDFLIDPVHGLEKGQCIYQNGPEPRFLQTAVPLEVAERAGMI